MTTSAISSTAAASSSDASSGLNMQDLLKILLTQLNYQDPLKPMDNTQFVAQIAQFASLNETTQLNTNMQQLLATQSTLQPVNLLGKTVTFNAGTGGTDSGGTISALSLQSGSAAFTVTLADGSTQSGITLSQITSVK